MCSRYWFACPAGRAKKLFLVIRLTMSKASHLRARWKFLMSLQLKIIHVPERHSLGWLILNPFNFKTHLFLNSLLCLPQSCPWLSLLIAHLAFVFPFCYPNQTCNCSQHEFSMCWQYFGLRKYLVFKLNIDNFGSFPTPLFLSQLTVSK